MSKNTIIAIVVGIIILFVILIFALTGTEEPLPHEEEPFTPEEEMPLPEEGAAPPPAPEEDLPIMELSEEELMQLQAIYDEAIPEMLADPEAHMDELMALDEKLMELTADELRELTVEDVREMLEETETGE